VLSRRSPGRALDVRSERIAVVFLHARRCRTTARTETRSRFVLSGDGVSVRRSVTYGVVRERGFNTTVRSSQPRVGLLRVREPCQAHAAHNFHSQGRESAMDPVRSSLQGGSVATITLLVILVIADVLLAGTNLFVFATFTTLCAVGGPPYCEPGWRWLLWEYPSWAVSRLHRLRPRNVRDRRCPNGSVKHRLETGCAHLRRRLQATERPDSPRGRIQTRRANYRCSNWVISRKVFILTSDSDLASR